MNRKIGILIIIILGIIILCNRNSKVEYIREYVAPPTEIDSIDENKLEIDTISEYIPQTIKREEYIPQSLRSMV